MELDFTNLSLNDDVKSFIFENYNINYVPFDNTILLNNANMSAIDDIAQCYITWQININQCQHDRTLNILSLRVNKYYEHQGYATLLLSHVINIAKSTKNVTTIELDDMSDNAWNLTSNVYIKHGFTYKNGFPFPEMVMKLYPNTFEKMKF